MHAARLKRVDLLKVVLVGGVAVLAAVLVALVATQKPAEAAFPGYNGKIAFFHQPNGTDSEYIYTMNPDGSNATRITPGEDDFRDNNVDPDWSPDGRKIAISDCSARSDEAHISIMNADGSNKTNITKVNNYSPFLALAPAWSPDGTRIAFRYNCKIHTMNPDGSNMTDITEDSYCPAASPDWQPLPTTNDVSAPVITNAPTQSLVKVSTLTPTTVRVKVGWLGTDNVSGVRYELEQSTNGGPYSSVALSSPSAISILRFLTPGSTYQYRVRAQDTAGNWSTWKEGKAFKVNVLQETNSAITYAGSWATQNSAEALGGAVRYANTSGSSAKASFSNALNMGWVSVRGSDRGKADLYPDGIYWTSYGSPDFYLPATEWRKVAFAKNGMNSSVPHTLEVKVLGQKRDASSGTRKDFTAFVVLSRP